MSALHWLALALNLLVLGFLMTPTIRMLRYRIRFHRQRRLNRKYLASIEVNADREENTHA